VRDLAVGTARVYMDQQIPAREAAA